MIYLKNNILLYHGSYTEVKNIDLSECQSGKDFGKGFYLTNSIVQAQHFVPLSINKYNIRCNYNIKCSDGKVSVYNLHLTDNLKIHYFNEVNKDWLQFVCYNRKKELFSSVADLYKGYDIIAGKIANDRTSTVITAYIAGAYGNIEDDTAINIAIQRLLPNKLENQYCFLTDKAIRTLEFVRSVQYDSNI